MLYEIIWPVAALGGLGLVLGLGLAVASKLLVVNIDPNIEKIRELLPGANCGGCGFPGCDGFAKALASSEAEISSCCPLSSENFKAIAQILGVDSKPGEKMVARILCRGCADNCTSQYDYFGVSDCRAAAMLAGGPSACEYGCVGLLSCADACTFNAIYKDEKGIVQVNEDKCTGCNQCVEVCPKNSIVLMPKSSGVYVSCHTANKGKAVATVCKAGCIGCSLCAKKCPEGAITMVNNLPVIDYDKCTGCGICAEVCPKDTIVMSKHGNALSCRED